MHRLYPVLFTLLVALYGCTTEEERAAALEVDFTDKPVSETWNALMRVSTGETPAYRIASPYVAEHARGDSTVLELGQDPLGEAEGRVVIDLYSSEGRLEATVESDRASYVEASELLTARGNVQVVLHGGSSSEATARSLRSEGDEVTLAGNVVMRAESGETLSTEFVRYDRAAERIYAPGRFEVRTASEWVRGTALNARADLSQYTFGNASGELEVHE